VLDLLTLPLVDGHCHPLVTGPVDAGNFELACSEADVPAPPGVSYLDGSLGLALRRWCAPILDLEPGAPIDEYLGRREELGAEEVARRLLGGAGLAHLLVDTGLAAPDLGPPSELGRLTGAPVGEVVRLERVAEEVAATGVTAAGFAAAYREALAGATTSAVAIKSIVAYRGGFRIDAARPGPSEVRTAAGRWLARPAPRRLDDPVLLRFALWCGIDRGLPLQIHAGFGDRDLQLAEADPSLLQPFLAAAEPAGVPIVLLHCYPYQRQAGWLAQVYPQVHVDVGLTMSHAGPRAPAVLAEFFELAPFGKLLFSTDGYRLPELYAIGAAQFRWALAEVLGRWIDSGAMPGADAGRVAALVAAENARRVYRL
jgi:predicted TIM-barrel fold metal-dependent hydrolase